MNEINKPTKLEISVCWRAQADACASGGKYNLAVLNISGVAMKNIELQQEHDQVVIVTANYTPGIYIVQMVVNGEIIETQKLVLIK